MAATLSADPSLETRQLRTVVWVTTSWARSQKNEMTTCYQCDRLSALRSPLRISPALVQPGASQPVLLLLLLIFFTLFAFAISGVSSPMGASGCERHWSLMACLMNTVLVQIFQRCSKAGGGKRSAES